MNIRVRANGGLGNKMRVLAACIALHKSTHEEIEVLWENSTALNCSFHKLFKPVDGIKIIEKGFIPWYNRLGWFLRNRELESFKKEYDIHIGDAEIRQLKHLKSDFMKLVKDFHSVFVNTCESFYGDESHLAYLLPTDKIHNEVERRRAALKNDYVGIHIRRGDNEESSKVSTTNLFNKYIAEELDENPQTQFYLSTDDVEEAKLIKKNFGQCIHYYPSGLNRARSKDIQAALIDLLTLSGGKKLVGSYWSSFSEVAAGYSGIPLVQVGK